MGPIPLSCRDGVIETVRDWVVNSPGLSCRFTAMGPGGTFTTTVNATCR
jgi:hypothetical protein